jgi:hypothetical protein
VRLRSRSAGKHVLERAKGDNGDRKRSGKI